MKKSGEKTETFSASALAVGTPKACYPSSTQPGPEGVPSQIRAVDRPDSWSLGRLHPPLDGRTSLLPFCASIGGGANTCVSRGSSRGRRARDSGGSERPESRTARYSRLPLPVAHGLAQRHRLQSGCLRHREGRVHSAGACLSRLPLLPSQLCPPTPFPHES